MEQIERTKRYLKRIENIYAGTFSSSGHNKHDYDDDVISFFIHCYHIRDWIIHLNLKDITAQEIDSYINNHHYLKFVPIWLMVRNIANLLEPHEVVVNHI